MVRPKPNQPDCLLYLVLQALIIVQMLNIYCIAENFDKGNFDIFDAFQLDHQNLTHQIALKQYSIYRCMMKDSNHPSKYFPSNI